MLTTSGLAHDFFLYPGQFFNYRIKSKFVVFVVCFWCGKEDNHFLNVVCTVSIIAVFALFFAAYELIGSRFLQASVELGLSTEKVSLKQSLLSPFLFLCSVITYWSVFRLFELVDWCNLSDDNLLHCFIFVHYRRARIVSGFPEVGELIRYLYSEINFLCADVLHNFKLYDFPGEMDLVALICSMPFVDLLIDFRDPWFIKKLVIFDLPVLKFWYLILRTLVSSIAFTISVLSFSLIYRFFSSWICSFVLFILMLSA